ncbi:MAG: hypothetical protein QM535_08490 [Limnohabitans sp.]|nr:hypothetical protein [Limnohabitans sp.]
MKLKKQIWYMLLLFIAPLNAQISAENTTAVFRLERVGLGKVLFHHLDTNALEAKNVSTANFNTTDGYLQAFIIKPKIDAYGTVYVVSAKNPTYFLKRNASNSAISFETYNASADELFQWNFEVADVKNGVTTPVEPDTFFIRAANLPDKVLRLDNQGNFTLTGLKNTSGLDMTAANDDEQPHQEFRFILAKANNVF